MTEPIPKSNTQENLIKPTVITEEEDKKKETEKSPKKEEKKKELFFKVVRNQKTSIVDPLDILKKEPTIIPIERQLEKHSKKSENNINEQKIKEKKYNCGLEISYIEDVDKEIEIISMKKNSLNQKILKNLESSIDLNLELYLKKLFCKFNYSPLIKKILYLEQK